MAIRFNCPQCNALLSVDDKYIGKQIKCGKCSAVCTAQEAAPVPVLAPAPEPVTVEAPSPLAIQAEKRPPMPGATPPKGPAPKADPRRRSGERDAKAGASSGMLAGMLLLVGGGLLFLVALPCLGGIAWFLWRTPAAVEPKLVPLAQANEQRRDDIKKAPIDLDKIRFEEERRLREEERRRFDEEMRLKLEAEKKFIGETKKPEPDPFIPPPPPPQPPPPPPPEPVVPVVAKFPPVDPGKLALKPVTLEADKVTRNLPGVMDDLVVGGGGRFLLFSMPQQKQVGMFDTVEGKVVHYFPAAEEDVKIAAGLTKLVMAFPTTKIIQRWDLLTKEKELTTALPDIGTPRAVLLGSASQGPVMVMAAQDNAPFRGSSRVFLNLANFKEIKVNADGPGFRGFHAGFTRVSANGAVFGTWDPGSSPQGLQSYVLVGNQLRGHYEHKSMGHIVPGPDGKLLFTSSGIFTSECKAVGGAAENRMNYVLPAVHGDFYVTVQIADRFGGGKQKNATNNLTIHMPGDTRPLLHINDIIQAGNGPLDGFNRWDREKFGNDKRILFVPGADLLVIVPMTNDRLELRRINIEETLDKSGIDYLYVASRAPEAVQRGTSFSYKLDVKSKKGGLSFKLDSGPQGMKVSTNGTVVWKVDADHELIDENVLLTVTDSAGQEVFHTFKVRVVADAVPLPKELPGDLKFEDPKKQPVGKGFDPPKGGPSGFGAIKPVKLDAERVERMLPATLSDITLGGGGRYLLITIPSQRKLALFDANEGKIVHYFPLAGDNAKVAAGRSHLVIAYPDTNILQRWNLETREKELTVTSPFQASIESVTMGYDSNGPILTAFRGEQRGIGAGFGFLDLKLKPVDVAFGKGNFERPGGQPVFLHASPDGTLFGCRDGVGGEPHRVNLLKVNGNTGKAIIAWISTSTLIPSYDNRFIYTGSGIFTPEMKLIHPAKEQTSFAKPYLPAVHGPYFLRLDGKQWDQHGGDLALFFQGNYTPFTALTNIDGVVNEQIAYGSNRDSLTYSKRIFLIPGANLLVSVPKTNDRLILHQVDMNQLLEKSPIDYLLVASSPPSQVAAGQKLAYKLDVRARKGGLKFNLDAGPKGMAVSPQGELTWTVPADFAPGEENIIITIRDAASQEIFHTFRLQVTAPGAGLP